MTAGFDVIKAIELMAAMMGAITGVFGGVLRDVVLNEVPMVLRDGRPYALASFIGCWLYLPMLEAGSPAARAMGVSAALIVAVRLVAWLRDWTLR